MNPVIQLFGLIYENTQGIIWHPQTSENPGKISCLV